MFKEIGNFLKQNRSPIMASIGVLGFGAVAVLAVKACIEFETELLEQDYDIRDYVGARSPSKEAVGEEDTAVHRTMNDDDRTYFNRVLIRKVVPIAGVAVASTVCVICASKMSAKDKASLMGAYGLLREAYDRKVPQKKYNHPVVMEVYDDTPDADILVEADGGEEALRKDRITVFDEYSNQYFETSMYDLIMAQNEVNHVFTHDGVMGLGTLQQMLHIPVTDPCNSVGWSLDAGEAFYNYDWIQFRNTYCRMDDGMECWTVAIDVPPSADYLTLGSQN